MWKITTKSSTGLKPKRPFTVTLLAMAVLSVSVLAWFGLFAALRHWEFLRSLEMSVPVWYLAGRGAVWGCISVPLAWGLWAGQPWARRSTQIVALIYALHFWVEHLLLAYPMNWLGHWPFSLGITIFGLCYTLFVLQQPGSRAFFGQ